MDEFPGADWIARYRARVNADPEMEAIGRWLTLNFAVTFGDARHVVRLEGGKIVDMVEGKQFDIRTPFGLRAPVEVWRKFLSPDPPPLYHDFFAMLMRVADFTLEGDSLILMQNARALHRMMNIMRDTGPPA